MWKLILFAPLAPRAGQIWFTMYVWYAAEAPQSYAGPHSLMQGPTVCNEPLFWQPLLVCTSSPLSFSSSSPSSLFFFFSSFPCSSSCSSALDPARAMYFGHSLTLCKPCQPRHALPSPRPGIFPGQLFGAFSAALRGHQRCCS